MTQKRVSSGLSPIAPIASADRAPPPRAAFRAAAAHAVVIAAFLGLQAAAAAIVPAAEPGGISWHIADVDSAFARARAERKPLFIYWGAVWCPPCNQVKSTIFNRSDFIERARSFVPVYVDGDAPSAQALSTRFKAKGYPTMILFRPDGTEITRLPGEVDPEQYVQVLSLGMNAARPVKALLAAALAPRAGSALRPDDWRQLAYYAWYTDEQQLVAKDRLAGTLQRLADACPSQQPAAARLGLRALLAAADDVSANAADERGKRRDRFDRRAAIARVQAWLADPAFVRANVDLLTAEPAGLVGFLVGENAGAAAGGAAIDPATRRALIDAWDAALVRLTDDASLSSADRLGAVTARLSLVKAEASAAATLSAMANTAVAADGAAATATEPTGAAKLDLPPALLAAVRAQVERADRATTNKYERQAVIPAAADALAEAGLLDESDDLLRNELTRSISPYYLMLELAANAKKRGDKPAALDWYEKAYATSQGPATRLQWGGSYVRALLDLAPDDIVRIRTALDGMLGELQAQPASFEGRNRGVLQRVAKSLQAWNREPSRTPDRAAVVAAAREQLSAVCRKLSGAAGLRAKPACEEALSVDGSA